MDGWRDGMMRGVVSWQEATAVLMAICMLCSTCLAQPLLLHHGAEEGLQKDQHKNDQGEAIKEKREAQVQQEQDVPLLAHNDKRAALLLDKLMFALQKALDEPEEGYGSAAAPVPEALRAPQVDLQRRGQVKGRYYVPCYFNAITCFRKK